MWDNDYKIYCPWDEPKEKLKLTEEQKVDVMKMKLLLDKIPVTKVDDVKWTDDKKR